MQPGRVMTSEELAEALAERERVEAKIEKFRLAALDDVIQDVRKTIELYKLTPTDLFPDVKVVPRNTSRRASRLTVNWRACSSCHRSCQLCVTVKSDRPRM